MNATDIRRGCVIKVDGDLCVVTDFQHVTPGKGQALMQTKVKNLRTGAITQRRFRSTEQVEEASLETRVMEYLYQDGNSYVFMDVEDYDQLNIGEDVLGDAMKFLAPNEQVKLRLHEGKVVSVDMPASVALEVVETDPGEKGNSVTNVYKPATLETGLVVKVPLFIDKGERVKVDTRTGDFIERAN